MMKYRLSELSEQVTTARAQYRPIEIVGGATKRFYGNRADTPPENLFVLQMNGLSGVSRYEPSELVMTAWAGTRLTDIDALLSEHDQMLPFDAPRFGEEATLGGTVAAGLSGPLSFGYGPLRHYVLGVRLLDAQGRILKFGGEVMKNVAGYDVSRLMAGSMGMFGALTEVSVKVLVRPAHDLSCVLEMTQQQALEFCARFRASRWPVKAAAWLPSFRNPRSEGTLCVRLAGSGSAVSAARKEIGGQRLDEQAAYRWWTDFRDQRAEFFEQRPLWRLGVRALTPAFEDVACAFDLAGELRWVVSEESPSQIREQASRAGGHATLFRAEKDGKLPADGVFHTLPPATHAVIQRLKAEFDPKGIFNQSRLVSGL